MGRRGELKYRNMLQTNSNRIYANVKYSSVSRRSGSGDDGAGYGWGKRGLDDESRA